jgi:uncharacterized protein YegP (UPF0339 family)
LKSDGTASVVVDRANEQTDYQRAEQVGTGLVHPPSTDGKETTLQTTVDTAVFEISVDSAGLFRWTLFTSENEGIADSGRCFSTHGEAYAAVEHVQRLAATASIKDV